MLPEIILLVATLCILIYNAFTYSSINKHYLNTINTLNLYIFITFLGVLILLFYVFKGDSTKLIYYNLIIIDLYGFFIKCFLLISTIIILYISKNYIKQENIQNTEFPILIGFAVISLMFFVSSFDIFSMYMSLELLSLCLYILTSFKTSSMYSAEAGLKYITLGALASGIMLYGMSVIYGTLLTLNFLEIKNILADSILLNKTISVGFLIGIICLFIGFLFKISAVPFHMWTPDVYEGAPTPVTAFFAITVKFGIFAVFLRFIFYVFNDILFIWQNILLFSGIITLIIGSLGALFQRKLKRLIAYSSINHAGYILLGMATGTYESAQSVILYLIIYVFMNLGFFFLLLLCYNEQNKIRINYISDLSSLGKNNLLLGFSFAIVLFSFAGIPPLAGFFSKYYIFLALMQSKLYFYALIGIILSVLSTFYYIRIVKIIFFENTEKCLFGQEILTLVQKIILLILLIILIGFCFFLNICFDYLDLLVESLMVSLYIN